MPEPNEVNRSKYFDIDTWDSLVKTGELAESHPFGPVIYRYTRAQAIDDGCLIDVTPAARHRGFRLPVAITAAAFAATVPAGDCAPHAPLDALLLTLKMLIRKLPDGEDRVHFTMQVSSDKSEDVDLWAHCGPGDNAEPVITIMLQGED